MSSTVTIGGMEITASGTSAEEMVKTLTPEKPNGKEVKALVDRGKPVEKTPEQEGLSKAASELGKKGGAAAAEARAKAAKEKPAEPEAKPEKVEAKPEPKPEPKEPAPEAKEAAPEADDKPKEKAGDPRFDAKARIDALTRQRHDAERRAAALEAKVREYESRERPQQTDDVPPTRERFRSDEEYADALAEHKFNVLQRDAERVRTARERGTQIAEKIEAFNAQVKDDKEFTEKVDWRLLDMKPAFMAGPNEQIGPEHVLGEMLILSDVSRDMFYFLTEHPDEVMKLLKSPNEPALRTAFGRLEGRLEAQLEREKDDPKPKAPEPEKESSLPAPFKPLKASSSTSSVDITEPRPFDEHMRLKKRR